MDPLLIAQPPPSYQKRAATLDVDEEMAFDAYCMVCDRLIVNPKPIKTTPVDTKPIESDGEGVKPVMKKRVAGGTIRVKNPDGSTTTRNANGQKVTRPGLKRNPNSSARLVAVNNAAAKLQPLTRSKTADATTSSPADASRADEPSPPSAARQPPFCSPIYCSKHCMDQDAGRSPEAYNDIARTLSYESGFPLERINTNLPLSDCGKSPYGPPSPLFVSGSDTESSSTSNGIHEADGPASSAPKAMEYFGIHREGPDDAWNDMLKYRRSSMQPASRRPTILNSNDSLSSLWYQDQEPTFARSISGSGKMRPMTPMNASGEIHPSVGRRTLSSGSDAASPIPARPLVRSNLSHTSLAPASPSSLQGVPLPPEFGSAPGHTLNLLQSYASAFPVRNGDGTSTSCTQRGFVFPGTTPESDSRRASFSRGQGTIRAKSKSDAATWDNYGKEVIEQRKERRASNASGVSMSMPQRGRVLPDNTPKQSLERDGGCWRIKYFQPGQEPLRRADRSVSRSSKDSGASSTSGTYHKRGLAIPQSSAQLSSSTSTAHSRTPHGNIAPASLASESIPDMNRLRLQPNGDHATAEQNYTSPQSMPRNGFDWSENERKGEKIYDVPEVSKLKLDRNKPGLFFFK